MKISKKVFLYTALTTFLSGILIISYFVVMLPGLYADFKNERLLKGITDIQSNNVANIGCVSTQTDTFMAASINLPKSGNSIKLCTPFISTDIEVNHPDLVEFMNTFKIALDDAITNQNENAFNDIDFSKIEALFQSQNMDGLFTLTNSAFTNSFDMDPHPIIRTKQSEDGSTIISSQVKDANNDYTSYVAFNQDSDSFYLTFASAMTPKLNELTPIVLASTPMILAFLVLFTLIAAHYFSKFLAKPIETLASQATNRHADSDIVFKQSHQDDEFKILEDALNQMHQEIMKSIHSLTDKNAQLELEKERQKLLMMNISHQLKTPLSSASLMVEGMIAKIGNLVNTDQYLTKVKQELNHITVMLESMLLVFDDLNSEIKHETLDLSPLINNMVGQIQNHTEIKNITVQTNLKDVSLYTDVFILTSIIENMLTNAYKYTDLNGSIEIILNENSLTVENTPAFIPQPILEHIAEPFVRNVHSDESGSGLGLYIVDSFVLLLGMQWRIENTSNGVKTTLLFRKDI